jgi:hypothetical protein
LSFGTLVHEALAVRYPPGRKRGPHPAKTFAELYAEQKRQFSQWDDEGNKVDALDLGVAMCEGYVAEYGNDDTVEIIAPEMALSVDVFDANGKYLTTWVGRGDAAYKDLARSTRSKPVIGFMEHKTGKTIEDMVSVVSGYGEQALSYWWAGSQVLQAERLLPVGAQVDHVLFNWLRKGMPDTRPRNADGYALNKPTKTALVDACLANGLSAKGTIPVLMETLQQAGHNPELLGEVSSRQDSPLFHREVLDFGDDELRSINWRIRREAEEIKLARANKLAIYKNPTRDCKWECQFKDACEVHEMGGDYKTMIAMDFTQWDPYEHHSLEDEKS